MNIICPENRNPKCHIATGMIISIRNSGKSIRYQTRELRVVSAVHQPTTPPYVPEYRVRIFFK